MQELKENILYSFFLRTMFSFLPNPSLIASNFNLSGDEQRGAETGERDQGGSGGDVFRRRSQGPLFKSKIPPPPHTGGAGRYMIV
jgi:hypothetical protein